MPAPEEGDEAFITEADLDRAGEFWREFAPPEMADLFDPEADTPS